MTDDERYKRRLRSLLSILRGQKCVNSTNDAYWRGWNEGMGQAIMLVKEVFPDAEQVAEATQPDAHGGEPQEPREDSQRESTSAWTCPPRTC